MIGWNQEKNVVQMWATISWGGVPYKIEMLRGRLHVKSEDIDKKKKESTKMGLNLNKGSMSVLQIM